MAKARRITASPREDIHVRHSVPAEATDPLRRAAEARLGTTLRDKWHLDELLGVGGTAAVYAATHRNGSRVAVKVLHAAMATNDLAREMFLWEGQIANAVGHEGVVKVLDDDTADDGALFLVTELLHGETLEERRVRAGGRLSQTEVLLSTDQLLGVLARAHAKGIVHRDLKPENVFLTVDGEIKVLDFGIAQLTGSTANWNLAPNGALFGTPDYMAPEQARGSSSEVDARSDLWACGAMMFFLLTGRTVHNGSNIDDLLAHAMTDRAPPLASVAPEVSSAVAAVVDRALEFSKDMRWQNAGAMREAVRDAYQVLQGHPLTTAAKIAPFNGLSGVSGMMGTARPPGALPSTVRPVALQDVRLPMSSSFGRRAVGVVVRRAVGAAVVIAVIAGAWSVARSHPRAPSPSGLATARDLGALTVAAPVVLRSASPGPQAADPRPGPYAVAPSPPVPATGPTPSGVRTNPPSGLKSSSPAVGNSSPSAAPTATTNCVPPYVVDALTGKKRWRLECL